MTVCNFKESSFVCRILAAGTFLGLRVQFQFVKQEVSHLLWRRNIQRRLTGHFTYTGLALYELLRKALRKSPYLTDIHFYAVPFHLCKHLGKGFFHAEIELRKVFQKLVSKKHHGCGLFQA